MIDKKIDVKEAQEIKKIYNYYLDTRSEFLKNSQFQVEDVFGDITSKDSISKEQITTPNKFSAKLM